MKRMVLSWVWAWVCVTLLCAQAWAQSPESAPAAQASAVDVDRGAALLLRYPGVKSVKDNVVHFADGTALPYGARKGKTFAERLEHADIEDHFAQPYPAFAPIAPPPPDFDPGRFRCDALLKKLYGASKQEVEANLVEVQWMPAHGGRKLRFNGNQNAAAQLQKVSDELDKLPQECMKYIVNIDGTYEYRPIEGTTRLSPHSYGIAIDLEVKNTAYWLWDKPYRYRNQIPKEVVDVFERHGFVWGGRWYHYDTMHFEYRPEMFEQVF